MKSQTLLAAASLLFMALLAICLADDPLDAAKVRRLHLRAKSGEKLTPEEQAYYERGKAARQKRAAPESKSVPAARATESAATSADKAGANKTSTGPIPLCDMTKEQSYKGEDGGLYGGGSNTPPQQHLKAALAIAANVQPLDADGKPSPTGKIVLLTHGMSNTTNESQRFLEVAAADPRKSPAVLIVDGALGGIDSPQWVSDKPKRNGAKPWDALHQRLKSAGASPQQVQVVWMKHAVARVSQYGDFPKHAQQLKDDMAKIAGMLKQRFPNLQLAYVSSRSYGGYAATELNPEPYAYECAFAVRWLIQDQIRGSDALSYSASKAPLLLWGPYIWADGEKGRQADNLSFVRSDYRDDGTHPSDTGRQKVAEQLEKFFTTDPTAKTWYTKP